MEMDFTRRELEALQVALDTRQEELEEEIEDAELGEPELMLEMPKKDLCEELRIVMDLFTKITNELAKDNKENQ